MSKKKPELNDVAEAPHDSRVMPISLRFGRDAASVPLAKLLGQSSGAKNPLPVSRIISRVA